jgi:hypothetical protein
MVGSMRDDGRREISEQRGANIRVKLGKQKDSFIKNDIA